MLTFNGMFTLGCTDIINQPIIRNLKTRGVETFPCTTLYGYDIKAQFYMSPLLNQSNLKTEKDIAF